MLQTGKWMTPFQYRFILHVRPEIVLQQLNYFVKEELRRKNQFVFMRACVLIEG